MDRDDLSDAGWALLEPLLPPTKGRVSRLDDRQVVNGVLWRIHTGGQWCDLPEKYGKSITVYQRFRRWGEAGIWKAAAMSVAQAIAGRSLGDPDLTALYDDLQAMAELAAALSAGRRARSRIRSIVSNMPGAPDACLTPRPAKRGAAGHPYRYLRLSRRKASS